MKKRILFAAACFAMTFSLSAEPAPKSISNVKSAISESSSKETGRV